MFKPTNNKTGSSEFGKIPSDLEKEIIEGQTNDVLNRMNDIESSKDGFVCC